ncbi:hypothetical protein DPMN_152787 [Dreissena polymorpha]|uniref:NACHT domain-containing protein n=1 Tax=Dreissena polymorpha TaxID=45954 RepID=A0A9D4FLX3_DREPO|nr:hypothetical protein DPMN_152787 [Dreissena polymorpha]
MLKLWANVFLRRQKEHWLKFLMKRLCLGSNALKRRLGLGNSVLKVRHMLDNNALKAKQNLGNNALKSIYTMEKNALKSKQNLGEERIESKTHIGEERIDSKTHLGEESIESKTHLEEERIASKTHLGEERIESKTHLGEERIEGKTHLGEERIEIKTHLGEERIDSKTHLGEERIEIKTHLGEERIEKKTHHGEELIDSKTHLGEERIESKTHLGDERIESKTHLGEDRIDSKTHLGEERIESKTHLGEERIASKTQLGEERIESKTHLGEERIASKTHLGEERIEKKTHLGEEHIASNTHLGVECIERKTHIGEERIYSKTHLGEERIEIKTHLGDERIENKTHLGEKRIDSKTHLGEKRIEIKTHLGEERIESKTQLGEQRIETKTNLGEQRIEYTVQDGMMRLQYASNTTAQVDYERGVEDFRRRLVEHYNDNSSNVPLSILDQSLDKRISDIYATPELKRIEIAKDGTRVKKEQILKYKELFYTENKSNRRIYVQGEPGSGKSTFAAKLVHDWSDGNQPSSAAPSKNSMFDDVLAIRKFKFIFFVSLRDSRGHTDVMHMIKKQLIDTMYSEQKRDVMYMLLYQIIETEMCLVVRDGLDEWMAPDGSNLAEPSMAGFPNDKCAVLTTSRPWKLADERIKNSQIDNLLEIEGIANPYKFSKKILRCILLDDSKDLQTIANDISKFISKRKLTSLSYSPMLFALVICTWVDTIDEEEHLNGSSLCSLWATLLESLCKKANDKTSFFNDSNPPPVKCFSSTSYLRPILQNVNAISNAAFHLLFSHEQDTSIVFNDRILSNYISESEKEFALKAGLLSKRKTKKASNASISFIHKSMQEYLAAYHIAQNAHLVDDVISGYLSRHKDAYLDISQVFIFLCGLNISAANTLSVVMNEHCSGMMYSYQSIIEAGYREAVLNEQTGILLRLSHFRVDKNNLGDVQCIWADNTSNAQVLEVTVYEETDPVIHSSHHVEFNLSSCHKLKTLKLHGRCILLKDSSSSVSSAHPVLIVLNTADSGQCSDHPLVLPCIQHIELDADVKCSSTSLRSLFNMLLTLDHEVLCNIKDCEITSCVEDKVRGSSANTQANITTGVNNTLHISGFNDSTGLWKVLHGLNIKSLSLIDTHESLNVNHTESLNQLLSSLTNLTTLYIKVNNDSPGLWEALRGLNVKVMSLGGLYLCLNLNHVDSLAQSLSSLKHLETLSIDVYGHNPGLLNGIHGLNIKSLKLGGMAMNHLESLSKSLPLLKQLETLSIYLKTYIDIQLPQSLKYLNIYCFV